MKSPHDNAVRDKALWREIWSHYRGLSLDERKLLALRAMELFEIKESTLLQSARFNHVPQKAREGNTVAFCRRIGAVHILARHGINLNEFSEIQTDKEPCVSTSHLQASTMLNNIINHIDKEVNQLPSLKLQIALMRLLQDSLSAKLKEKVAEEKSPTD
ncbi:MAG: hypothetical protein WAZ18_05800 [Alphaproteobacteria bacterium]